MCTSMLVQHVHKRLTKPASSMLTRVLKTTLPQMCMLTMTSYCTQHKKFIACNFYFKNFLGWNRLDTRPKSLTCHVHVAPRQQEQSAILFCSSRMIPTILFADVFVQVVFIIEQLVADTMARRPSAEPQMCCKSFCMVSEALMKAYRP